MNRGTQNKSRCFYSKNFVFRAFILLYVFLYTPPAVAVDRTVFSDELTPLGSYVIQVDLCTQVRESLLKKKIFAQSENFIQDIDKNYGVLVEGVDKTRGEILEVFIPGPENLCSRFIAKKIQLSLLRLSCRHDKNFVCKLSSGYFSNKFFLAK